jgi:hypothetical protein
MRHLGRLGLASLALVILLAGCFGSSSSPSTEPSQAIPSSSAGSAPPSAEPEPSAAGSGVPEPSGDGSARPQPSADTPEPIPSEDLPAFSCDLPIVENPTVGIANITDVRIGEHDGYDRVVFEFEQGTPEFTLDRATPPFIQDGSGEPVDVEGTSFLGLTMRGGTKQTDAGTSSYDGPTDFDAGMPGLVHLIEGGDFERQSTWYFGLAAESCVRVLVLEDPPRVVIDIEHP